jgi:hypothetical protein
LIFLKGKRFMQQSNNRPPWWQTDAPLPSDRGVAEATKYTLRHAPAPARVPAPAPAPAPADDDDDAYDSGSDSDSDEDMGDLDANETATRPMSYFDDSALVRSEPMSYIFSAAYHGWDHGRFRLTENCDPFRFIVPPDNTPEGLLKIRILHQQLARCTSYKSAAFIMGEFVRARLRLVNPDDDFIHRFDEYKVEYIGIDGGTVITEVAIIMAEIRPPS